MLKSSRRKYLTHRFFQETHILHKFEEPNLYDRILKVCITTYLRPEADFTTVDNLIEAINGDIKSAHRILDTGEELKLKTHSFFTPEITTMNGNSNQK